MTDTTATEIDEPLDRLFKQGGEMGALMRAVDWATTSVGPPATWPRSLRGALGLLLGSASQLCLLWGKDFTQFYNDAFRPILGATKHPAAMGQAARECWSEVWDVISPMYAHVAAGGATAIREGLLVLQRNGFLEECYFDYTYSPIRDESSEIVGILAICAEVTERVLGARRMRTLAALNARAIGTQSRHLAARAIADALAAASSDVPFALVYLTSDGADELRLAAAAGVDGEATGGWPFDGGERDVDLDPAALGRSFPGGPWPEPAQKAMVLPLRSGGTERPHGYLVVGASPRIPFDSGYRDFLRLVASTSAGIIEQAHSFEREKQRVAEFAALDRAKTTALEEAERGGRVRDEFLATMSHELRTPLSAILGWAKLVRDPGFDPHRLDHGLAVIERNAEAQARLIGDLLDVSRIISGKLRLSISAVDIAAVLNVALDVVRQAADAKGVILEATIDPGVGLLTGDPDRLQQVVWNLLSNAVKYTPAGGRVRLEANRQESRIFIRVIDTGSGIAPEHLPLIFERFRQIDGTTTRAHGGLGLGLAIVRHLVEAHGGSVDAASVGRARGATFTVSLPIRAVVAEHQEPSDAALLGAELQSEPQAAAQRLHNVRVLVVDDEPDSRELITVVLETEGAKVRSASSVAAALDLAATDTFDLLVSDIGMPGQDGYALIKTLRARGDNTPALALTAFARLEDAQRARSAGFQQHFAKPIVPNALVVALLELLRRT